MCNYVEWKTEWGEIMVEVLNNSDLNSIQKQYLDKGYVILETFLGKEKHYFFVVGKVEA